jgi:hypothetical protein
VVDNVEKRAWGDCAKKRKDRSLEWIQKTTNGQECDMKWKPGQFETVLSKSHKVDGF